MFSISPDFLFDAGIPLWANMFGIGYAVLSFVIVVFLEARMMKGYLEIDHCLLPFRKRIQYSFTVNTVSTILGLPLVYLASIDSFFGSSTTILSQLLGMVMVFTLSAISPIVMIAAYSKWLVYAFILSVVAEFVTLLFIVRKKVSIVDLSLFAVFSNIASYILVILLPVVFSLLGFIILAFTSTL